MSSNSIAPKHIDNLLFDLGGVIIDLDRKRAIEAFLALGIANINDMLGLYVQAGTLLKLEAGELTIDEFHNELRGHSNRPLSDEQIDEAFNSLLVGIPIARLQALEQLRERYNLYILSNTNPIMFGGKIAQEFKKNGHSIEHYFKGWALSYEAGYNKPHKGIFDYTVKHLGIDPGRTLFLDDSLKNVEVATACGFNAQVVAPGTEFIDIINNMGL